MPLCTVNKAARASFLGLQAWGDSTVPPWPLPAPPFQRDPSPCPPTSQGEAKPKQTPKLSCPCLISTLAFSAGGRGTGQTTGGTSGEEE